MNNDLYIETSGPSEDPQTAACREIARRFADGDSLLIEDWRALAQFAQEEVAAMDATSFEFDF